MSQLSVRTATPDDAVAVFALQSDLRGCNPQQMAELIRQTLKEYPFLVAEHGDKVVGYAHAGAHRALPGFRWSVDVSVQVAMHYHLTGVGQKLYQSLARLLGEQGFMTLYAAVPEDDPHSVALHQGLGFEPIGVHQNIDLQGSADYWCLALGANPAREEPVPFDVLRQRQALNG
jgi:phosphinothricin acetyltransferase